jgi:hypothetical protein
LRRGERRDDRKKKKKKNEIVDQNEWKKRAAG